MNESWHIPRASLASSSSSSSNSSNKSYSNPSTVARHSRYLHNQEGQTNLAYNHTGDSYSSSNSRNSNEILNDRRSRRSHQKKTSEEIFKSDSKLKKSNIQNKNYDKSIKNNNDNNEKNSGIKRGSRSSQGSTDSNNSTHSASSGSLLLTAANLERFAAIHKKQNRLSEISENRQNYNTNITISQQQQQQPQQQQQQPPLQQNSSTTISTITTPIKNSDTITSDATVIDIDPNLHFVKTKDVDSVSIASSTHFTMVNGVSGPQRKTKEGLCSRGHQVTVLIVSMSFFFLIGISTMVYLLEMRAREMPMN